MSLRVRYFILTSLFVCLVLGAAVPQPLQARASSSELRLRRIVFFSRFSQGKNYFLANQFLESSAFFKSLLSQVQDLPPFVQTQIYYYYGASLDELGVRKAARRYLNLVLGNPAALDLWSDAVRRTIRLMREMGTPEKAEPIWETASHRIPSAKLLDPVRWEMAQNFYAAGLLSKATGVLQPIKKRSRFYGPARFLTGTILQEQGRGRAALATFRELAGQRATLQVWNKGSMIDLARLAEARLLFDLGQYSRALAAYRRISKSFPGRDEIEYEKAWCYASLKQYDLAVDQLERVAEQFPESPLSRDSTLLAGYFYMEAKQFAKSYATFDTVETSYRKLARKLHSYIRQFPDVQMLGKTVMSPVFNIRGEFPPQIRAWIYGKPVLKQVTRIKKSIDNVDRLLNTIQSDIQEVQILTASYGASFKNPLTLELNVRNDVARKLADIQSRILEMMGARFRNNFRNAEYLVINRAQEVRRTILQSLDKIAIPLRIEAVRKQNALASIADYLRLVRPDGFGLPADPATNGITVTVFGTSVIDAYRRTLDERQGLAQILMKSAVEEDHAWAQIVELVEIERRALEAALKRLGVWGRYRYLIDLDRLYRKTLSLQRLVEGLSASLMKLRGTVLDEVMQATNKQRKTIDKLEAINLSYRGEVNGVRYAAYAKAIRDVAFDVREAGIAGSIGKLDLSWRINKFEQELGSRVLAVEQQRIRQTKSLYKRILSELDKPVTTTNILPASIRKQLGNDEESEEIYSLMREIRGVAKLLKGTRGVYRELAVGSSGLLDRPGVLRW